MAIATSFSSSGASGGCSAPCQAGMDGEPSSRHSALLRSTTNWPQYRLELTSTPLSKTRGTSSSAPWYGARMCGWIIKFTPLQTVTTPSPASAMLRTFSHRFLTTSLLYDKLGGVWLIGLLLP